MNSLGFRWPPSALVLAGLLAGALLPAGAPKQAVGVHGLTPRTVAFHKYQMMGKLRLESSAELVQFAIRQGVIT